MHFTYVDQHYMLMITDQATPPGQCLMENKRIDEEKISLLQWKVCFKYLFYRAQCV